MKLTLEQLDQLIESGPEGAFSTLKFLRASEEKAAEIRRKDAERKRTKRGQSTDIARTSDGNPAEIPPLPSPPITPLSNPPFSLVSEKEKTKKEKGNGRDSDEQKAFDNWNTIAEQLELPKAVGLSPERRRKIRPRLHEHGLAGWNQALRNLAEMPFCCGQNDRGWRVTFDWMLSPTNLMKVLEKAFERAEGSGERN